MSSSIEETLDKLGLTKYESLAYTYILQNGSVEAAEITKDTNIPNGKIYETLNKLERYGFIEIQESRPKRYHSRNINIAIEDYLDQKKQSLESEFKKLEVLGTQAIQEFEQLHMNNPTKKEEVFWRTAFGPEIHDLYLTTMREAKNSIIYFLPHSVHDRHLGHDDHKKHRHERGAEINQEKEFITKLFSLGTMDKTIQILFAGQQECPFFKELFGAIIGKDSDIEVKAIQQDIVTPPLLLVDDAITIMDIVDPLDSHTTIGITKIWDRRLNSNLKEKLQILWKRASNYRTVFPLEGN